MPCREVAGGGWLFSDVLGNAGEVFPAIGLGDSVARVLLPRLVGVVQKLHEMFHRRSLLLCHAARSRAARCSRSEEHTSELQSLMRISYAVFCWKKKTSTP